MRARSIGNAFAELERRRWVRRSAAGQVGFAGGAVALKRFLDEAVRDVARARFGAEEEDYPALLDPDVLARCGYFSSFPHSVCLVSISPRTSTRIEAFRAANTDSDSLRVPDPCRHDAHRRGAAARRLSPRVPRARRHDAPARGARRSRRPGKAFRYESRNMEGIQRLWDFSMREIVFVGSAGVVEERRARVDRCRDLAHEGVGCGLSPRCRRPTRSSRPFAGPRRSGSAPAA